MSTADPTLPTATNERVIAAADTPAPEKTVLRPVRKPKKVKKVPAKAKPRSPSLHPPYFEMIKEAIVTLKERTGSSQYAIGKFIEENQKHLPANFKKVLLTQLKKLVAAGKLVKVKASYKLPTGKAPAAGAPAKKKPVAKPKAAAKPKTVKKITPAKKKTVAKPKPAPKPKAASKPKPAAKAKAAATKAKPKAKATSVKAAKVARTSTRTSPVKKATAAVKKAAPAKKAAVKRAAPAKKAAVKSLKPKAAIAKKASGTKKAKK